MPSEELLKQLLHQWSRTAKTNRKKVERLMK
jgi:hypothetical protein